MDLDLEALRESHRAMEDGLASLQERLSRINPDDPECARRLSAFLKAAHEWFTYIGFTEAEFAALITISMGIME